MTKTKIYCPDIECDSCVKLIKRRVQGHGIGNIDIEKDAVVIEHDPDVKASDLVDSIKSLGFRADTIPILRKTFGERFRDMRENPGKYTLEYRMLRHSLLVLLALLGLEALIYAAFQTYVPDVLSQYGWWIFYLDISVVSIGAAMWHLKSYRISVSMMAGMMIGMTFGMQTGLMIGTVMGATNGIFIGSITGMILAIVVGIYNGRCCGIMGVLEGMMAGLMNGVMGAMTGVMLFTDHILWFMPFFIGVNVVVMWGLSYMLFEEVIESNQQATKSPVSWLVLFAWCLVVVSVLIAIMMYGPKSGLARVF